MPSSAICADLALSDAKVDDAVALRREQTRRLLVPRPEAVGVLAELRGRGRAIGLVTACTGDVVDLWPETPLAPLVDATVFSCAEGVNKPDPRIFELAAERLGVGPSECLYVGDGANDDRSYALAREVGDTVTMSYAVRHLAFADDEAGRHDLALARFQESAELRPADGFLPGVAAALP